MELLENHTHVSALFSQLLIAKGGQLHAIQPNLACCGTLQKVDAANQCAFAGTAQPDDAEHLSFFNICAYAMEHLQLARLGAEPLFDTL